MVVASPGYANVLVYDCLTLPLEAQGQTFLKNLEVQTQQIGSRAHGHGVLGQPVAGVAQFSYRQGAHLHTIGRFAGCDIVAVIQYRRARTHELQVPVHRILIQAHKQVEFVTMSVYLLVTDTNVQEDVAASDDGLVGVIGVQVESAPNEDTSKNIARSGDTLSGFTSDRYREIKTCQGHRFAPCIGSPGTAVLASKRSHPA